MASGLIPREINEYIQRVVAIILVTKPLFYEMYVHVLFKWEKKASLPSRYFINNYTLSLMNDKDALEFTFFYNECLILPYSFMTLVCTENFVFIFCDIHLFIKSVHSFMSHVPMVQTGLLS